MKTTFSADDRFNHRSRVKSVSFQAETFMDEQWLSAIFRAHESGSGKLTIETENEITSIAFSNVKKRP